MFFEEGDFAFGEFEVAEATEDAFGGGEVGFGIEDVVEEAAFEHAGGGPGEGGVVRIGVVEDLAGEA